MNRLPTVVEHKAQELLAVIGHAADDVKIESAEASLSGDFTAVVSKIDDCKRLQILEMEIKACIKRFEDNRVHQTHIEPLPSLKRNPTRKGGRAKLRVKLGDKMIEKPTVSATFVQTLAELGLERVATLNKKLSGIPLLAKTPNNGYQTQKYHQGWYVTTHFNTPTAMKILQDLGRELRIPLHVQSV